MGPIRKNHRHRKGGNDGEVGETALAKPPFKKQVSSFEPSPSDSPDRKRVKPTVVALMRGNRPRTRAFPTGMGECCMEMGSKLAALQNFTISKLAEVEDHMVRLVEQRISVKMERFSQEITCQVNQVGRSVSTALDSAVKAELGRMWLVSEAQIEKSLCYKMVELQMKADMCNAKLQSDIEKKLACFGKQVDEVLAEAQERMRAFSIKRPDDEAPGEYTEIVALVEKAPTASVHPLLLKTMMLAGKESDTTKDERRVEGNERGDSPACPAEKERKQGHRAGLERPTAQEDIWNDKETAPEENMAYGGKGGVYEGRTRCPVHFLEDQPDIAQLGSGPLMSATGQKVAVSGECKGVLEEKVIEKSPTANELLSSGPSSESDVRRDEGNQVEGVHLKERRRKKGVKGTIRRRRNTAKAAFKGSQPPLVDGEATVHREMEKVAKMNPDKLGSGTDKLASREVGEHPGEECPMAGCSPTGSTRAMTTQNDKQGKERVEDGKGIAVPLKSDATAGGGVQVRVSQHEERQAVGNLEERDEENKENAFQEEIGLKDEEEVHTPRASQGEHQAEDAVLFGNPSPLTPMTVGMQREGEDFGEAKGDDQACTEKARSPERKICGVIGKEPLLQPLAPMKRRGPHCSPIRVGGAAWKTSPLLGALSAEGSPIPEQLWCSENRQDFGNTPAQETPYKYAGSENRSDSSTSAGSAGRGEDQHSSDGVPLPECSPLAEAALRTFERAIFSEEEDSDDEDNAKRTEATPHTLACPCRFCDENYDTENEPAGREVTCQLNNDTVLKQQQVGEVAASVGCFVDGGAGIILAGEDGVLRYYDAICWKEKGQFLPPKDFFMGAPGGCWVLTATWHDSEDTPMLLVVSRDFPAFCCWNFETGAVAACWSEPPAPEAQQEASKKQQAIGQPGSDHPKGMAEGPSQTPVPGALESEECGTEGFLMEILKAMDLDGMQLNGEDKDEEECREESEQLGSGPKDQVEPANSQAGEAEQGPRIASWKDVRPKTWWARPSGPVLAVGSAGSQDLRLIDIRDGQILVQTRLVTPLAGLGYSSPIHWLDRKRLVVAEEVGVGLWNIRGGRAQSVKFIELPRSGDKMEAMTAMVAVESETASHYKVQFRPPLDGAFSTTRALYLVNWQLPNSVALRIDYTLVNPPDCLFLEDCYLYAGMQGVPQKEHTRICKWDCRTGELVDQFVMEKRTPGAARGPVTQLWAGYGKVFGVHAGGLYVFQHKEFYANWPHCEGVGGRTRGQWDPRLVSVLGRGLQGGMAWPNFDGAGDRLVVMAANHPPCVYFGV